jgi:uncharacterized protein (TIGR03382 family)
MKTRAIVGIVALAGTAFAAQAQEMVTFSWAFTEVLANTTTPVANPNGLIEPGEGAELRLSVSFTPAVGGAITYTPPPGTGNGTVGGLASIFFDLSASAGHNGTFHNITRLGAWGIGGVGSIEANGVTAAQAGQFPLPGQTANPANPINNIWRVRWTPNSYENRVVTFTAGKAAASSGTGAGLYIEYGGDPEDPAYVSKQVAGNFGSAQITVIPSPSSLALLGLGGLVVGRRRR